MPDASNLSEHEAGCAKVSEVTGDRAETVAAICAALANGDRRSASEIARSQYPFEQYRKSTRAYTPYQSMRVFLRDGFRDRYSGRRLIFPGTLRLLSKILPDEFPVHRNWKMSETHSVFWELFPTVDHLVPITRGGADVEENWITTSMLRNSAKSSWTIEELGWSLLPIDCDPDWDGLTRWCLWFTEQNPEVARDDYMKRWCMAADQSLK